MKRCGKFRGIIVSAYSHIRSAKQFICRKSTHSHLIWEYYVASSLGGRACVLSESGTSHPDDFRRTVDRTDSIDDFHQRKVVLLSDFTASSALAVFSADHVGDVFFRRYVLQGPFHWSVGFHPFGCAAGGTPYRTVGVGGCPRVSAGGTGERIGLALPLV